MQNSYKCGSCRQYALVSADSITLQEHFAFEMSNEREPHLDMYDLETFAPRHCLEAVL